MSEHGAVPGRGGLARWLYRDSYTIVGYWLFAIQVATLSFGYINSHEAIYLLGSRRVVDPEFLARDLTWSTVAPMTFLHDHMLAPLWSFLGDFGIVCLGRLVSWALFAWALVSLARVLRLPPWSVVVGCLVWILAGQTVVACGSPLEGFQPKSFSYPLLLFAIAFTLRGQHVRAGLAAGAATAFHIIVGGWACMAIALAMLLDRKSYSYRSIVTFCLATAPFIVPSVAAIGLFHVGGTSAEDRALIDQVYVTFAWPVCCDPVYFLSTKRVFVALGVFLTTPFVLRLWSPKPTARFLSTFVGMLVLFFAVGLVARALDQYWLLKVYPFQLANGLPSLFLCMFGLALFGEQRPTARWGRVVWIAGIVAALWFVDEGEAAKYVRNIPKELRLRSVIRGAPSRFGDDVPASRLQLYAWIKRNTPRESIFVTPYLPEFWTYAERAQVAAFRHPPHDHRFLDWMARLRELNRSKDFREVGYDIKEELDWNEGKLPISELVRMRDEYGAAYYIATERRNDLIAQRLYDGKDYCVYDLTRIVQPTAQPAEAPAEEPRAREK